MAIPSPVPSEGSDEAARFVRAFAELWSRPTVERFRALMHPDVRLVQPLAPPANGVEEAAAWFVSTRFPSSARFSPDRAAGRMRFVRQRGSWRRKAYFALSSLYTVPLDRLRTGLHAHGHLLVSPPAEVRRAHAHGVTAQVVEHVRGLRDGWRDRPPPLERRGLR